jgi:hypothetical protein
MNKWILAALASLAGFQHASPASAQAPTREGYTLPMIYDSFGAQHHLVNGYSGDVMPPMVPQTQGSALRRGRGFPFDARAQAGSAGPHRSKRVAPR